MKMKKNLSVLLAAVVLAGCQDEDTEKGIGLSAPEIVITGSAGSLAVDKMKWLRIQPEVKSEGEITCKWIINENEVADTKDLLYAFSEAGSYNLEFKAKNDVGETKERITVEVADKKYANKITRVYEFLPAPGQFTNKLPVATAEDTPESMRKKVEDVLTEEGMISLGGFGGYVVFGFDHTVINKEGADFVVLGNAFKDWSEPGVILVSYDANDNGKPDDEWYEIAGSEYLKPATIKNYEITYYKPEKEPENPDEPNYIRWTDNQGKSGYLAKNRFHGQTFYPLWKGDSYTLAGTLMVSNIYDQSGTGTYWVNPAYDWGYADNWANTDSKAGIDIDWAVDKDGNKMKIRGIDFVKVYTGNRAEGGWLGEVSTEVCGFNDLNLVITNTSK